MKTFLIWALAVCLFLGGCGRSDAVEKEEMPVEPQRAAEPVIPTEIHPTPEEVPSGWRAAYAALLEEKAEQVCHLRNYERSDYDPNTVGAEIEAVSGRYILYDIDKDGVPELLFRCQSGWYTEVYACQEEQTVLLGGTHTKNASFYHWPEENAVALDWAHMGGHTVTKLSIKDGKLAEEVFFAEYVPTEPYTDISEVLPGSRYLWEARTLVELPEPQALTLPLDHYGREGVLRPVAPERDGTAKDAIEAVLTRGGIFYGVTADGFGGDTGWITLKDYLVPGGVTPYNTLPMEIRATKWLDFNGDGQREALLTLGGAEGDEYGDTKQVIFAWDGEGTVYAYCHNYMEFYDLMGTSFIGRYDNEDFAVAFEGPQIYFYGVEQE